MDDLANQTETLTEWSRSHRAFNLELESISVERYNALLSWLNITHCRFVKVLEANRNKTWKRTTPC